MTEGQNVGELIARLTERRQIRFNAPIQGGGFEKLISVDDLELVIAALSTSKAQLQEGETRAAIDVLAERKRQIEVEGWTPEHDDEHANGELASAAATYALSPFNGRVSRTDLWPWGFEWWKPKDRRSSLVKAGALILAEIERLDRKEARNEH